MQHEDQAGKLRKLMRHVVKWMLKSWKTLNLKLTKTTTIKESKMELQSESISKITKALCEAQKVMQPAKKTQTNPFFKSKYLDLNSLLEMFEV